MNAERPTLSDQVTRLYDVIAGYHATNLIEIARELGVWEVITAQPGITSDELARRLRTLPFYTDVLCRTAFAFGFLERDGAGWRMGPHFDRIFGDPDSSYYLVNAPRTHMLIGEDYGDFVRHFREGTKRPYQDHGPEFMAEVAMSLKALPRIFLDAVLADLPELEARFEAGARVLDVGCGAGWAIVQLAERFPGLRCVGVDIEPHSVELARALIAEHGLEDRCEARLVDPDNPGHDAEFDIATSFLVVHELEPAMKPEVLRAVAAALVPGGSFLVFDEVYPDNDDDLRTMPQRFAALAQWYELTWGNRLDTSAELRSLCEEAGLEVTSESEFSRFHIVVATKTSRSLSRPHRA